MKENAFLMQKVNFGVDLASRIAINLAAILAKLAASPTQEHHTPTIDIPTMLPLPEHHGLPVGQFFRADITLPQLKRSLPLMGLPDVPPWLDHPLVTTWLGLQASAAAPPPITFTTGAEIKHRIHQAMFRARSDALAETAVLFAAKMRARTAMTSHHHDWLEDPKIANARHIFQNHNNSTMENLENFKGRWAVWEEQVGTVDYNDTKKTWEFHAKYTGKKEDVSEDLIMDICGACEDGTLDPSNFSVMEENGNGDETETLDDARNPSNFSVMEENGSGDETALLASSKQG
jgi:hypothetical protein